MKFHVTVYIVTNNILYFLYKIKLARIYLTHFVVCVCVCPLLKFTFQESHKEESCNAFFHDPISK